MRTKTLLIAAAALAATVISSQAQTVYSQNIVGYANTTLPGSGAYSMLVAPLAGTNTSADTLMPSLQSGDEIFIWTGVGYYSSTYYGVAGGGFLSPPNDWIDQYNNTTNAPNILPGQGYFYSTASGNTETNTFSGTVVLTNSIPFAGSGAYALVGSTPPVAGYLDSTNFNLPLASGDEVFVWTGNAYYSSTYYGIAGGGFLSPPNQWIDQYNNTTNAPYVNVGQAFFYSTASGNTEQWNQSLTVQ